jgi:hypothetical protein
VERIAGLPAELVKCKPTDGALVDAAFTAVLKRLPRREDKESAVKYLAKGGNREARCQDMI